MIADASLLDWITRRPGENRKSVMAITSIGCEPI
jgi:hypothetical protein